MAEQPDMFQEAGIDREPLIRLAWHDQETVGSIPRLIGLAERIEISLPENYNHAMFRALHPDTTTARLEQFDVSGGLDLLHILGGINGLESLNGLAEALEGTRTMIRVVSPPTLIFTLPDKNPRWSLHG